MELDLIEPNIHPVLVHFAYALSVVAAGLYALALLPRFRNRPGLSAAADWSLFLAGGFVVLTIAAGFQAYYSVAHDGPSHEAMTTHRNWAVPSGTLIVLLAIWRFTRRVRRPSALLSSGVIGGAALLTVTAWWGGHLVYSYGLGVESLPEAGSGDGHDHAHGDGTASEVGAMEASDHANGPGEADGHAHGSGGEERPSTPAARTDLSTPEAAADSLAAAYAAGDEAALRAVLSDGLLVAEGGGVEDGLSAYASHHMGADLAASADRHLERQDREVRRLGEDAAMVLTTYEVHRRVGGADTHRPLVETAVMERAEDGWTITHLHWSFGGDGAPTPPSPPSTGDAHAAEPHGELGHAH